MDTVLVLAAITACSIAVSTYMVIVPKSTAELGSLASVPPPHSKLVQKYYPITPDGKMAPSKLGPTYYRLIGNEAGPRLVFIHGVGGTSASFPLVIDSLVSRGYRVLVYDVYGHGYSSSPGVKYDESTFTTQLLDLLNHVGWKRANILGYSMGGGISAHFADRFPERVNHLLLVAPSGLLEDIPLFARILSTPILGPFLAHTLFRMILVRRSVGEYANDPWENEPHEQLNILYHPGFIRAYAGTIADDTTLFGAHKVYERIGKGELAGRVFCVWLVGGD
ncbi:hypothetical protein HDU98_011504 [Podochytrium sp. JEL0797]|nr:hypothetical protein HDU98_011504 [Podochytrium sp. JEL0797]